VGLSGLFVVEREPDGVRARQSPDLSTEGEDLMSTTTTLFMGWPADATAFLADIAAANTAEFWAAHRERYEVAVRGPLRALVAELREEFGEMRIFRPTRDRRFRPDAEPYRIDAGAAGCTEGGTERSVVLSAQALVVRVGHYAFDGPQLRRYRAAVEGEPGAGLERVLSALGEGLTLGEVPALARAPRGVAPDHPRIGLLRLRALHVGRSWPVGPWLATPEPLARVAAAWRAAGPVAEWLDVHVGPPAPR
jgi:uncharacterized protein (TIGR02453 family)